MSPRPTASTRPDNVMASVNNNGYGPRGIVCSKVLDHLAAQWLRLGARHANAIRRCPLLDMAECKDFDAVHATGACARPGGTPRSSGTADAFSKCLRSPRLWVETAHQSRSVLRHAAVRT